MWLTASWLDEKRRKNKTIFKKGEKKNVIITEYVVARFFEQVMQYGGKRETFLGGMRSKLILNETYRRRHCHCRNSCELPAAWSWLGWRTGKKEEEVRSSGWMHSIPFLVPSKVTSFSMISGGVWVICDIVWWKRNWSSGDNHPIDWQLHPSFSYHCWRYPIECVLMPLLLKLAFYFLFLCVGCVILSNST